MHLHDTTNTSTRGLKSLSRTGRNLVIPTLLLGILFYASCKEPVKNEKATAPVVSGTYSDTAQIFALNVLSNIGVIYNDSVGIQTKTTTAIDAVLGDPSVISVIGQWSRVWGAGMDSSRDLPKHPEEYVASNTMYIAQKSGTDTFVVAIAGTNAASLTSWIVKDFNVVDSPRVWTDTNGYNGPVPHVTDGTLVGYQQLQNMMCNGMNAGAFLTMQADSIAKKGGKMVVWVTGHSLGGALSPVYALHLRNSVFYNDTSVSVWCLPVAGATPGDTAFSRFYTSVMGNTTIRVWNSLDVVPHGFEPDMEAMLPDLYKNLPNYSSKMSLPLELRPFLPNVETMSARYGYYQLYPNTIINFQGQTFTTAYNDTPHCPKANDVSTFEGQAGCQHTQAYATRMGIDSFQCYIQRIFSKNVPFFSEGCNIPPHANANTNTANRK